LNRNIGEFNHKFREGKFLRPGAQQFNTQTSQRTAILLSFQKTRSPRKI